MVLSNDRASPRDRRIFAVQTVLRFVPAAQSVSNANISVTGVNIPGNADGTPSFAGGWTRMNEEGGELASCLGGSAIIPADQTERW